MHRTATWLRKPWLYIALCALLCAGLIAAINLVGFLGGGQDDGRYLEAAQCWASNGPCLPHDHWSGRWPVFAPVALFIELLGTSRATIQIWPILCSTAALYLCGSLAIRLSEWRSALLAMVLLAATPAFNRQFGIISVEAVELCMAALAGSATVCWIRSGKGRWAFAAGLCFGLGFATRETAIAWAAMIAAGALAYGFRPAFKDLVAAAAGAAVPIGVEMIVYWMATGDPFFRLSLSLSHGRIPSSELATSVDVSKSPLLNPDFIGGWRREPGAHVHWLIDGPLNLLLNGGAGYALTMAPLLYFWARKRIDGETRKRCMALLVAAAVQIVMINYVFAMDPKPRVFLPAIMAANIVLATLCVSVWDFKLARPVVVTCISMFALSGFVTLFAYARPADAQDYAERVIASHPQDVEMDEIARSMFQLADNADQVAPIGSGRHFALYYSPSRCSVWLEKSLLPPGSLSLVQSKQVALFTTSKNGTPSVCLFRYDRPVAREDMLAAGRRNWRTRY